MFGTTTDIWSQRVLERANPLPADAHDWPLMERIGWLETVMVRYRVSDWHLEGRLREWIEAAGGQFPEPPEPWRRPFDERVARCAELGFDEIQIDDNRMFSHLPVLRGRLHKRYKLDTGRRLEHALVAEKSTGGRVTRYSWALAWGFRITLPIIQIARSIVTEGFMNPVVARPGGPLFVGNERHAAAALVGWPYEIPVIFAGYADHLAWKQARGY